jgi:5-formyltetrahydrofolate cyclo-ligase
MYENEKNSLRDTLKAKRSELNTEFKQQAAASITKCIQSLEVYKEAKHIALYQAFRGEVDLTPLWHASINLEKTCYFPTLNEDKTLSFIPASHDTLWFKNKYGILEPDVGEPDLIDIGDLDILFAPLLGFDANGNRLGMGAGYYDRTLAGVKPQLLAGIAYDFQKIATLHPNDWDVPLDLTITERKIYWSKKT